MSQSLIVSGDASGRVVFKQLVDELDNNDNSTIKRKDNDGAVTSLEISNDEENIFVGNSNSIIMQYKTSNINEIVKELHCDCGSITSIKYNECDNENYLTN